MVDALADMARTWLPLVLTTAATLFLGGRFVMGNHASLECCRLRLWVGWVMNQLSLCQRMYVRSRRPFRIILMRHAESEGNVDRAVYEVTPDHSVKITERGKRQGSAHREARGE